MTFPTHEVHYANRKQAHPCLNSSLKSRVTKLLTMFNSRQLSSEFISREADFLGASLGGNRMFNVSNFSFNLSKFLFSPCFLPFKFALGLLELMNSVSEGILKLCCEDLSQIQNYLASNTLSFKIIRCVLNIRLDQGS